MKILDIKFCLEYLRGRDYLEGLGIHGRYRMDLGEIG
jgi:hypothetical protein